MNKITDRASAKWVIGAVLLFALAIRNVPHAATGAMRESISARNLVGRAIAALGGEEVMRSIQAVKVDGIGHTYLVEQSERAEGPWIVNYRQITELRDYVSQALRRTGQNRSILTGQWVAGPSLIFSNDTAATETNGKFSPGSSTQAADALECLSLSPDRLLLTALEAKDLANGNDQPMQGTNQHEVHFHWRNIPVRIFLSAETQMPTAVEFTRPYPASIFWGIWGEVTTRTYYSLWTLEETGFRYPRQLNTERNGTPYQEFTATSIKLNPDIDEANFAIPAEVVNRYQSVRERTLNDIALGEGGAPPTEIAAGIVQILGNWNVTLIRQDGGIVIIEAPISSGYSAKVMAYAQRRFPGLPIKAVISTSDAWPHIGGLREYVARNIPLYILDLNLPTVRRLIECRYRIYPDELEQKRPVRPQLQLVSGKVALRSRVNTLEIYPVRTETGERMLMVYLPDLKLLYGADLVQPRRDGSFFMPEYLLELATAAQREKLAIDRVFAMHSDARPWSEVVAALSRIRNAS
jgi:Metallo-beta-lactamase superfamily